MGGLGKIAISTEGSILRFPYLPLTAPRFVNGSTTHVVESQMFEYQLLELTNNAKLCLWDLLTMTKCVQLSKKYQLAVVKALARLTLL